MSSLKRMRMISDDQNADQLNEMNKLMKYQSSVNVHRMSDLDKEINDILNRSIDDSTKSKLYSQALRRFLKFKESFEEETSVHPEKPRLFPKIHPQPKPKKKKKKVQKKPKPLKRKKPKLNPRFTPKLGRTPKSKKTKPKKIKVEPASFLSFSQSQSPPDIDDESQEFRDANLDADWLKFNYM